MGNITVIWLAPFQPQGFNLPVQILIACPCLWLYAGAYYISQYGSHGGFRNIAIALQISGTSLNQIPLHLVRVLRIGIDRGPVAVEAVNIPRFIGS